MTINLNIGEKARMVVPTIEGVISDIRYNKAASMLELLLDYTDTDGAKHQRWFLITELEGAK